MCHPPIENSTCRITVCSCDPDTHVIVPWRVHMGYPGQIIDVCRFKYFLENTQWLWFSSNWAGFCSQRCSGTLQTMEGSQVHTPSSDPLYSLMAQIAVLGVQTPWHPRFGSRDRRSCTLKLGRSRSPSSARSGRPHFMSISACHR